MTCLFPPRARRAESQPGKERAHGDQACADICPVLLSSAPAETEDFEVDVRASEETVRAGQPFNVTCTGPPGPGFQQQWLHPKSQARRETLFL